MAFNHNPLDCIWIPSTFFSSLSYTVLLAKSLLLSLLELLTLLLSNNAILRWKKVVAFNRYPLDCCWSLAFLFNLKVYCCSDKYPFSHSSQPILFGHNQKLPWTHQLLQVASTFVVMVVSLYSLIGDFLLSQINIWTTTTWSNAWVVLPKPSWYEFFIGLLIWTPASKYLHLTTFSNIYVILSMFLYL